MPRTKRKVSLEQYFTTRDLAGKCVKVVSSHFPLDNFGLIFEPSAGDGVFLEFLPKSTQFAIDIDPKREDIIKSDFLQQNMHEGYSRVLTIGNPPFGQRGSLAMKFIKKAATFSDVIAFILPRSFQKDTFINSIPANFHPVDSFLCEDFRLPDNTPVKIKCVFQIWERRDKPRVINQRPTSHPDFALVHAHISRISPNHLSNLQDGSDLAIAQVGANFKPKSPMEVTAGSYWFVRCNADGARERFDKLDFSFLDNMNSSFKSLSKKDIVQAYQSVVDSERATS